jgi:hypothetical protein
MNNFKYISDYNTDELLHQFIEILPNKGRFQDEDDSVYAKVHYYSENEDIYLCKGAPDSKHPEFTERINIFYDDQVRILDETDIHILKIIGGDYETKPI